METGDDFPSRRKGFIQVHIHSISQSLSHKGDFEKNISGSDKREGESVNISEYLREHGADYCTRPLVDEEEQDFLTEGGKKNHECCYDG